MVPGRYTLHRVGSRAKSNRRKVMSGYDAHTIGIRIVVGKVCKLCRVKIYSNSRVRGHGRLEWPLLSLMSFVLEMVYKGKEEVVFRVPEGYGGKCKGFGSKEDDRERKNRVTPS